MRRRGQLEQPGAHQRRREGQQGEAAQARPPAGTEHDEDERAPRGDDEEGGHEGAEDGGAEHGGRGGGDAALPAGGEHEPGRDEGQQDGGDDTAEAAAPDCRADHRGARPGQRGEGPRPAGVGDDTGAEVCRGSGQREREADEGGDGRPRGGAGRPGAREVLGHPGQRGDDGQVGALLPRMPQPRSVPAVQPGVPERGRGRPDPDELAPGEPGLEARGEPAGQAAARERATSVATATASTPGLRAARETHDAERTCRSIASSETGPLSKASTGAWGRSAGSVWRKTWSWTRSVACRSAAEGRTNSPEMSRRRSTRAFRPATGRPAPATGPALRRCRRARPTPSAAAWRRAGRHRRRSC